jgi:hypothetical protein
MDLFSRTIRMLPLVCAGGVLSSSGEGEGADAQVHAQNASGRPSKSQTQ